MNCFIYLKRISGLVPLVLVAIVALRERLRRVFVRGKLRGLGINTGVGILSRVELVVM